MPYFSIVIPTYNRANFIKKNILAFLDQSFSDFELIIVDDGSTDDTTTIVKSITDNRIRYFKILNNERAHARNYGWNLAKGEYVNFFDSDDLPLKHHLQIAYEKIIKHNYPKVLHFSYAVGYDPNNINFNILLTNNIKKNLIYKSRLTVNGAFINNSIRAENIKFCEERKLSATEDWLFWLQLAARYDFIFFNDITSILIQHDSRSMILTNPSTILVRAEILNSELKKDDLFMHKYGIYLNCIKSEMISLCGLHYSIIGDKINALKFELKAIYQCPRQLFTKRFLAIIKKILLK